MIDSIAPPTGKLSKRWEGKEVGVVNGRYTL